MTGRDFGELLLTVWWMFACALGGGLLGGGLAALAVLGVSKLRDLWEVRGR